MRLLGKATQPKREFDIGANRLAKPVGTKSDSQSRSVIGTSPDRTRGYFVVLFFLLFAGYLAVIIPPFQIGDEDEHLKRAYFLSTGEIVLNTRPGMSTGGMADVNLLRFIDEFYHYRGNPNARLTETQWATVSEIPWAHRASYSEAPGTGYYFPLIYLPQSFGLTMGRLADLTVSQSYMLAKSITLFASCAMLFGSFWLVSPPAPVLAVLILPMTVYQASSAAIDFLSIAATVLVVSIFLRSLTRSERMSLVSLVLFTVLIFMIATSRLHMIVLIFLSAIMYLRLRDKRLLVCFALLSLGTIAWYLTAIPNTVDLRRSDSTPPLEIMNFYVGQPMKLLSVIGATLMEPDYRVSFFQSFVGKLGWWDTQHPPFNYFLITVLLSWIGVVSFRKPDKLVGAGIQLSLITFSAMSFLLVFASMIVAWTPHPAELVEGIQGRYFIPPMILLLYALFYSKDPTPQKFSYEFCKSAFLFLLAVVTVGWNIEFVVARYYFHGIFY